MHDIHDRAPRRPDEQSTKVVLGGVGICFNRLVECDTVHSEIGLPSGDPTRNVEPGCRVCVFLAIEGVQRTGRRVSGIKTLHISTVVGCVISHLVRPSVCLFTHRAGGTNVPAQQLDLSMSARVCRCCRGQRGTRFALAANTVATRPASACVRVLAACSATTDAALGGISGSLRSDKSFLHPGDGLRRDGVNGDTTDNATLSGTTSTLMLAQSTIEGSVKTRENLMILPHATGHVVAQDGSVLRVDVIAGRWVATRVDAESYCQAMRFWH